jgi:hypothetical protein
MPQRPIPQPVEVSERKPRDGIQLPTAVSVTVHRTSHFRLTVRHIIAAIMKTVSVEPIMYPLAATRLAIIQKRNVTALTVKVKNLGACFKDTSLFM